MHEASPLSGADIIAIQEILLETWGIEARGIRKLPGEYDLNVFLKASDETPFLLKIAPAEATLGALEFQNSMLDHLSGHLKDVRVPEVEPGLDGRKIIAVSWQQEERNVRLLHWVSGKPFSLANPHDKPLLASLGEKLGKLSAALEGFDHPGAHMEHEWDIVRTRDLVKPHLELFTREEDQQMASRFLELFEDQALPALPFLRKAVNYNDANDWNIMVAEDGPRRKVSGFIDFGDAVFTIRISELAIALAYAMMDKADPIAAAVPVIKAYHQQASLAREELAVLFPLIGARLLLSVFHAARRAGTEPQNPYLQISREQSWALLRKLDEVSPLMAHCLFREACGFPAHPSTERFLAWADSHRNTFQPVLDLPDPSRQGWIDLSIGSAELGNNDNFQDADHFDRHLQRLLEDRGLDLVMGGYHEVRPFYTTEAYRTEGLEGPEWRTLHLGMDLWQKAGSPVFAPLPGVIHSLCDNKGERNYGPTIILEHTIDEQFVFYTLYGHLGSSSLEGKKTGDSLEAGQQLGVIGDRPENGNWPPHLHWQLMLDLPDHSGDFPGVGLYRNRKMWKDLCPDPILLMPHALAAPSKKKIKRPSSDAGSGIWEKT